MTGSPSPLTIHVLAAFDRFNYGDLLFAWLAEHGARRRHPDATIAFYGTHASDMSAVAAQPTAPMRELFAPGALGPGAHVMMVAGGEVLGTRWHRMYEHVLPPALARAFRAARGVIGVERMDWLCQRHARVPSVAPWIPDPQSFGPRARDVATLFNSVGGLRVGAGGQRVVRWQRDALGRATWLSVRDARSARRVAGLGLAEPPVSPDSAVVMRDLPQMAPAALDAAFSQLKARSPALAAVDGGYIAAQCGVERLPEAHDALAAQLRAVHEAHGLPVVAFAIGRAAGHEDHLVARRLSEMLGAPDWLRLAPEDMSVWEIAALIAKTRCYIGSSMHGYITAFAFGAPRVGIASVRKMIGFRDQWDLPEAPADAAIDALPDAVGRAMALDPAATAARADAAAARHRADAERMWEALDAWLEERGSR